MKCLICNQDAERIQTMGDWVELKCPECDHYRVDGEFFAHMKENKQIFDIGETRKWLKKQRAKNIEPLIGPEERYLIAH